MEKTLLYHYTSLSHLIEIFKVGKVLTSQTEKMLKVKKPGLWFSTNNKWEYSAFKRFNDGNKEFDLNTPEEFEKYIGCARLVTNLNSLFVTFAKYKHKSKVNPMLWEKMAEIGNPNSITDACVAALCARTAVRGAFLNVQINCLDYNDKSFVDDINKKGENILEKAFKLENKIISITEKIMKK